MATAPKVNPWDRRPWPLQGDDAADLYRAVGFAISVWEELEYELADLFSKFVGGPNKVPARRAYVAVRTFEGRIEMLRAASYAYFHSRKAEAKAIGDAGELENVEKLQSSFKSLLALAKELSPRRNEIAHGYVSRFAQEGEFPSQGESKFGLFPSFASFRERDMGHRPTYCMGVEELSYFTRQFDNTRGVCMQMFYDL